MELFLSLISACSKSVDSKIVKAYTDRLNEMKALPDGIAKEKDIVSKV
jgi:hypothetical protein